MLGGGDRTGRRQRLHPRSEAGRMPNRSVFGMRIAGPDRAHHDLAGINSDASLDGRMSRLAKFRRVTSHLLLYPQRRIQRALRMVLMRDRRAEQGEDAVAGGLHDVS